jgi:hypothetical protein
MPFLEAQVASPMLGRDEFPDARSTEAACRERSDVAPDCRVEGQE